MKKKIKDDYGLSKAIKKMAKQEKQVEKEYTGKQAKFTKETNRKLAGKWVADEKNKVLYQVKEITGCDYPYVLDKPPTYLPPMTKEHMLYHVKVSAIIDVKRKSATVHVPPVTLYLYLMDSNDWEVVSHDRILTDAQMVSARINNEISELAQSNTVLLQIAKSIYGEARGKEALE